MKKPLFIVMSAPSGCGKSTLIDMLLQEYHDMVYSISCTTRSPRDGEEDGIDYHFMERGRFEELVAEGAFGRLLTAAGSLYTFRGNDYFEKDAWRGTKKGEGGSVLINQSIHYFDLLLWIAGGADAARAFAANLGHEGSIETEDTVSVALRMRNGALGSFVTTNAGMRQWVSDLAFQGTAGSVEVRDEKLFSLVLADKRAEAKVRARIDKALAAGAKLFPKGKDYYGPGHQAQIDDFVRAVRTGTRPFVTFADAAESDAMVFAAYASAARR